MHEQVQTLVRKTLCRCILELAYTKDLGQGHLQVSSQIIFQEKSSRVDSEVFKENQALLKVAFEGVRILFSEKQAHQLLVQDFIFLICSNALSLSLDLCRESLSSSDIASAASRPIDTTLKINL